MHPILVDFGRIQIYSYGFCIMLGALIAYFYALKQSSKVGLSKDHVSEMTLLIIAASYIGGKVFLWFSDWNYYIHHPQKMIELNGSGFVFYGSFIFCISSLLLFFKFRKVKPAPVFDVLAVCTAIVHGFGKIGCLMAGCCHGKVCSSTLGIVYENPLSQAHPLHTPLYPVQLMDAAIIFGAALFLIWYRNHKKFSGELMLWYVFIYATGRFMSEFLRGDDDRGFVGIFSQSQWVSIALLVIAALLYRILRKHADAPTNHK
jgi:phosphatidylglycerol:prolipoprotein diacylglycerol transferase